MKLLTLKATIICVALVLLAVMVDAGNQWLFRHEQTETCIHNLLNLDAAKQQWALEEHQATNAVPTWNDLHPYLINILFAQDGTTAKRLFCPVGGVYTIGRVADAPTCSIAEHVLAMPDAPEENITKSSAKN